MKLFLRRAAAFSGLIMLLAGVVPSAGDIPRPSGLVSDQADLLSDADRDTLTRSLQALEKKSVKALLITLPTTGGVTPDKFVRNLAEKWGLRPQAGDSRSFLILLAVEEKRIEVAVSKGLADALPAGRVNQILEKDVLPVLREGKLASALYIGIKKMDEKISLPKKTVSAASKEWTAGATTATAPAPALASPKTQPKKKGGPGILWLLAILAAGILILRRYNPRRKWGGLPGGSTSPLPQPSPLRFGGPPRSRGLGAGRDF